MTLPLDRPTTHVKYRLTAVFTARGFHPPDDAETVLIEREALRAVLVRNPDSYLTHADQSNAVANLMLRGLLGGPMPSGTVEERVASFVEEARVERRKRHGNGPFLVITAEGEQDAPEPREQREEDGFIMWIDVEIERQ